MISKSIHVHTIWRPERQATEIHIMADGFRPNDIERSGYTGKQYSAKPMEFEEAMMTSSVGPALLLEGKGHEFMQAMMDSAWDMGLRPSGVKDIEGTLEATRFHLEDMRLLAKVRT